MEEGKSRKIRIRSRRRKGGSQEKQGRIKLEFIKSVPHMQQGERVLFRRKKSKKHTQPQPQQQQQAHVQEKQQSVMYDSPAATIRDAFHQKYVQRRLNSMLQSINKSTDLKRQASPAKAIKRYLKRQKRQKLKKDLSKQAPSPQKHPKMSMPAIRRYRGSFEQLQRQLQDRHTADRINKAKAASYVCKEVLEREYREHRVIVGLREQYQKVHPYHKY